MNNPTRIAVTNRAICYRLHEGIPDALPAQTDYESIAGPSGILQDPAIVCLLRQIRKICENRQYQKILLREKDLSAQDYRILARQAHQICKNTNPSAVTLIVHNFADTAEQLHADLHLPFSVFRNTADHIRQTYPHIKKIGVSVHSIEDAVYAETHGADYVIAGHIFDTDCKKGLPGRGLPWLISICSAVTIPVYAIGGITEKNIGVLADCPVAGVCMMSSSML